MHSSFSHTFKASHASNSITCVNYYYSKRIKSFSVDTGRPSKDIDILNAERLSKKYFGKKISQLPQFQSHSHRHSRYYCKYIRKLVFPVPYSLRSCSNPLERLCLLGKDSDKKFDVSTFNKSIAACKYLHTLKINEEAILVYLKTIKPLRHLQSLTFCLKEDQIYKNTNPIKGLKSLKSVSVVIQRQDASKMKALQDNVQINMFAKFCQRLLSLPNLKSIKLNLQDSLTSKYPDLFETLLEELNKPKITTFNVQARLVRASTLNVEKIAPTLNEVDFLGLRVVNTNSKFIIFDGSSLVLPGTTYNEEIDISMEKRKKVLDLHFKDVSKVDMESIITQCPSLKSLGLHFGNSDTLHTLPHDISFIKGLENVIFSFEGLAGMRITETLSRLASMLKGIYSLDSVSLLFIFSKLKEEALSALGILHQVMRLSKLKNYTFQFRDKFKFRRSIRRDNVLETVSKQIMGLNSLESLKIEVFVHDLSFLQDTKMMLSSLRQLKKLHLSIKSDSDCEPSPTRFYFPFDELVELSELRLRLKFSLLHDCGEYLVRNISKLKNLEVLEIMEGTLQDINIGSFCDMLKELSRLPKLKELTMNAKIAEENDRNKSRNEAYGEENLTFRLKRETEKLFYSSPRLEKVHIYHSRCYNLRYTR